MKFQCQDWPQVSQILICVYEPEDTPNHLDFTGGSILRKVLEKPKACSEESMTTDYVKLKPGMNPSKSNFESFMNQEIH